MKKNIIISIIIIAVVALGFWLYKSNEPRDVISTKSEVVKSEDNTATVQIANHEMVQVRFSWEVDGIKYNDALNLTKEEYDKLTPEQIEKMKQERFDNWMKMVNKQSRQ